MANVNFEVVGTGFPTATKYWTLSYIAGGYQFHDGLWHGVNDVIAFNNVPNMGYLACLTVDYLGNVSQTFYSIGFYPTTGTRYQYNINTSDVVAVTSPQEDKWLVVQSIPNLPVNYVPMTSTGWVAVQTVTNLPVNYATTSTGWVVIQSVPSLPVNYVPATSTGWVVIQPVPNLPVKYIPTGGPSPPPPPDGEFPWGSILLGGAILGGITAAAVAVAKSGEIEEFKGKVKEKVKRRL